MDKNAKWVGSYDVIIGRADKVDMPAYEFRKIFDFNKIDNVKLKISGLGFYNLFINGKRVNDDCLNPAFSDYTKTVYYVEYNIDNFINIGKNVICIKLGNGFYNQGEQDTWSYNHATWRDTPRFILEISSNNNVIYSSDSEGWKYRKSKYTYYNSIRLGEYVNGNFIDNWKALDYDDIDWFNARIVTPVPGILTKENMPLIRECEIIKPVNIIKNHKGYVIDFGKNIAGYVSFRMKGKKNETINIQYAEKLYDDSTLDNSNISIYVGDSSNFQLDKYTFGSDNIEEFKPEFVYHGFRYIEITGISFEIDMNAFKAYFVHTDLKSITKFNTTDEMMEFLYDAGRRSILSNYHSIPTDCPQREKNGWTGDASASSECDLYLFDMKEAFYKFTKDIMDSMRINGQLSCIVPTDSWGYSWGFGPAWDQALFILPFTVYKETGDTSLIDLAYDSCKKYLEFANYYRSKDGLVRYGLSDWCPPRIDEKILKIASNEFSDSCIYYNIQVIMAFMHKIKKHYKESKETLVKAEETKNGIIKKYIDDDNVDTNGIGSLSMAIYYNIVKGSQAKKIAKKLVKTIKKNDYILTCGFLGSKALFNVLSDYHYNDIAYKMLERREYPSFGFMKDNGATTLWEAFELGGYVSRNHHMYSEVTRWVLRNIGGLKNDGVGYDKVIIEPYIYSDNFETNLEKETRFGSIVINIKTVNGKVDFSASIPHGISGKIILNKQKYDISSSVNHYIFNR